MIIPPIEAAPRPRLAPARRRSPAGMTVVVFEVRPIKDVARRPRAVPGWEGKFFGGKIPVG